MPVQFKDRYSILLELGHCQEGYFSQEDIARLKKYIEKEKSNLESAVLFSKLKQSKSQFQTLLHLQKTIFSETETSKVIQMIADKARRLISAGRVVILYLDGSMLSALCWSGEEFAGTQPCFMMPVENSWIGEALFTNKPVRKKRKLPYSGGNLTEAQLLGESSFLIIPLVAHNRPIGAMVAIEKTSGFFGPIDEQILRLFAEGASIALENTRLYQEEQERRREAEGMQRILARFSSDQPLPEKLSAILKYTVKLFAADSAVIYWQEVESDSMAMLASTDMQQDLQKRLFSPLPLSWNGDSGKFSGFLEKHFHSIRKEPAGEIPGNLTSALRTPLFLKQTESGLLDIFWSQPYSISPNKVQLAEDIGRYISLAIERDQLNEKAQQLVVLQEQQRIASRLHDTVAQILFRIGLEARWCDEHIPMDQAGKERIKTVRQLVDRSNQELRHAVFELQGRQADRAGNLVEHLDKLVAEFEQETGIAAILVASLEERARQPGVDRVIDRIVRESLCNTYKHAQAHSVVVSVIEKEDTLTVIIQDDGIGFSDAPGSKTSKNGHHFGIDSMRRLVRSVGGDLLIGNNDDHGAIVKAGFPAR